MAVPVPDPRDRIEPEWTFGERLAKARRTRGLNQEEMAAELHVSPSTVAKWEANRGQPRQLFALVARWSDVTGVSEEWILGSRTGSR